MAAATMAMGAGMAVRAMAMMGAMGLRVEAELIDGFVSPAPTFLRLDQFLCLPLPLLVPFLAFAFHFPQALHAFLHRR